MLLRSRALLSGLSIPNSDELERQVLLNRIKSRNKRGIFSLRAMTATRMQGWVAAAGIVLGAAFFLGPWMLEEYKEMLGYKFVPQDPSRMPRTSPEWWENEWRKLNPTWRAGESTADFFVKPYAYVRQQTGRDLSSAAAFVASRPSTPDASSAQPAHAARHRRYAAFFGRQTEAADSAAVEAPARALVPLCGDSPIIRTMALQGFEVDAIDASPTAMRAAVERTERGLPPAYFPRIRLHWRNFFDPELWDGPLKGRTYDIIYERQGMTSLNRDQRPDYAYLLKRALRPDGVLYVEGIFRTGRVKGNRVRGPPYTLSKAELTRLFPQSEGYFVRCEEKSDAMSLLSREDRILQRIPKQLYVTPFSCAVFKAAAVNLTQRPHAEAEAPAEPHNII